MDYYDVHAARCLVGEYQERRMREASAERLARELGGGTRARARTLLQAIRSVVGRDPRPARVRPEW